VKGLVEKLRAVLVPLTATPPPRCFACTQDVIPLESLGGGRWLCSVCSKDFSAERLADDTWLYDLTPLRHLPPRR